MSGYAWVITKDHFGCTRKDASGDDLFGPDHNERDMAGVCGPRGNLKHTREKIQKEGDYFCMYGPGGVLYYEGYSYAEEDMKGSIEHLRGPLDDFGTRYAGATEIKYRNPKTGKVESIQPAAA